MADGTLISQKATRKLVILYGHSGHVNSLEMQHHADKNDILLLYLPSYTTQALQQLYRVFFKPFKVNSMKAANQWEKHHPQQLRKIIQAVIFIGNA